MAPTKTTVIVPLYIYPLTRTTWDPLYTAQVIPGRPGPLYRSRTQYADTAMFRVAAYPNLDFLVIVNPNSGPSNSPIPDANYTREIPRLNAQPNVRTIGYVRTNYCMRSYEEASQDVATYGGWWKHHNDGVYVEGIFFDETPDQVSEAAAAYLDKLTLHAKSMSGLDLVSLETILP